MSKSQPPSPDSNEPFKAQFERIYQSTEGFTAFYDDQKTKRRFGAKTGETTAVFAIAVIALTFLAYSGHDTSYATVGIVAVTLGAYVVLHLKNRDKDPPEF